MRLWLVVLAAALASSCGDTPLLPPTPPVDLDARTTPVAADFSSEQDLAGRYRSPILAHFEAVRPGTLTGTEGVALVYRVFKTSPENGSIVLVPGRSEPVRKYAEVIWDLNRHGWSVYAFDHRGQGDSGRLAGDPELGYVEYFRDYVDDLHLFMQAVVKPAAPRPFLLAHSMGGGISLLYMDAHPGTFAAAVFSAPMVEIDTGAFPESAALTVAGGACSRGGGKTYAAGQEPFDLAQPFEENDVTHSLVRFDLKMSMYREHPELRIGGASYRWLCEALLATSRLQTLGARSQDPVLLLEAGLDSIVRPRGGDRFCAAAPRCQKVTFPDAYHEILMERDEIRNEALARAIRFYDAFR